MCIRDRDSGDYSKPLFGTAPGYVNLVPKLESMSGNIVFDLLMNAKVYGTENHVEFIMKDGRIDDVVGGIEAENFKKYLASFNDPNMYKISHNMFGFNPNVHKMCGEVVKVSWNEEVICNCKLLSVCKIRIKYRSI